MSPDNSSEFKAKRAKTVSTTKPAEQAPTALPLSNTPKTNKRDTQRQNRRNRGSHYFFCKKKLTEFKLLQDHHHSLKQARDITKEGLSTLLSENPDLRDHATDIPLDKLPVEALYYLLKIITLSASDVDQLMQQGPVAWVCLRDIVILLSENNTPSLVIAENIHTLLTHVAHTQPIAYACRLLSSPSAQRTRDTSSYLNQEIFNLTLLAGSDAPHVAACYKMLRQQQTDIPSPTLLLSNTSSHTKMPTESKKTTNEDNIKAWLVLFIALPGLATAYEAIWDSKQLLASEKFDLLIQAIKLGTNIQAISSVMKMLSLNHLLDKPKITQLFSIFTVSQKTFLPSHLVVDITLAKTDVKKLPALKEKLADKKYASLNAITAYRLGKILTSTMIADAFDEEIWASLFQKMSHLFAVMTDALCYLADQPAGKYKPDCKRILTKPIINQVLDLLAAPRGLSPQQLGKETLSIVSTAMGNQSPLPNLNAKYYPQLYLQVTSSSAQNKRTTSGFSSFFSSNPTPSSSSSSVNSAPVSGLRSRPSSPSLLTLKTTQPKKSSPKRKRSITTPPPDSQFISIKTLVEKALQNPTSEQQQIIEGYTTELISFSKPDHRLSEEELARLAKIEKDLQRLVAEQEEAAAAWGYAS